MNQWDDQAPPAILPPLQVSPRGFKASLEAVINAMVQQGISATVLAQLPSGDSWLDDLKRYFQSVSPSPNIYLLSHQPLPEADWYQAILMPAAPAKPDTYCLIAVSAEVGIMVSGQRQRVFTSAAETVSQGVSVRVGEDIDGSPVVDLTITFQRALVHQVLETIRSTLRGAAAGPQQSVLQPLLNDWDRVLQLPSGTHPAFIEVLLMQQSQQQEQLRQQAQLYRGQAMTASNLTTQNEVLVNTLRLKDDFVNTVGQELRTPISTIKTALPLLSSPSLKPAQRQRYLEMISRECDRQSSLINGVLDLLQLEQSFATATVEAVSLFEVVPGVVSIYQPIAQEKGVRLAYTVPDTLPPVYCPESWVRQIVIHLLSNSIRYTKAGGEVWVTAQADDSGSIALNVRDSGIGIPPNELPRIFDHFYRGKQANHEDDGAGLGLTIVKQLLLYCGGKVDVESQPGIGTHFKVHLPIDPY